MTKHITSTSPADAPTLDAGASAATSPAAVPATIPQASTAVAIPDSFDDIDDGLGSVVEQFGVVIPRIVTNGKFGYPAMTDEPTGEVLDQAHVTILAATVGRAWWEGDKPEKGKAPDCRSFDCEVADPESPAIKNGNIGGDDQPSGYCPTCPLGQFGPNNERPACKQSAQVLVFDHDNEGIRVLRVAGTSIKKFNKYAQAFRTSKKLGKAFEWVTDVGSEVVADDYDKHNELTFKLGERLEAPSIVALLQLRDQVGWKTALERDMAREETQHSADAATGANTNSHYGTDEEPF